MTLKENCSSDIADTELAMCFKGLADPNRVAIARHLLTGEHRVTDLVEHMGLAQSTVSAHVGVLRRAGMLSSHVHGRAIYYALAHPDAVRSLLQIVTEMAQEPDISACREGGGR